jgi:hypothetical protein
MRLIYVYCEINLWALAYTDLTTSLQRWHKAGSKPHVRHEAAKLHHPSRRAAAAWPVAARAQEAAKLPIIGFLVPGTPSTHGQWFAVLMQRLRELGWTDGRTVAIEYR